MSPFAEYDGSHAPVATCYSQLQYMNFYRDSKIQAIRDTEAAMHELKRIVFFELASLLFCFLLIPSAMAQSEGPWSGISNTGGEVHLQVIGGNVEDFWIEAYLTGGSSGFGWLELAVDPAMPVYGSSFSFHGSFFDVQGTFTGSSTCTGTYDYHDPFLGYSKGTWTAYFLTVSEITLSPSSNDFGERMYGTTSNDVKFTLKNKGASSATGSVFLTGANADQFEITSGDGPFSLVHNQSRDIYVRFIPTSEGIKTATLTIDADSPCNDASAYLTGTGTYPVLSVTPNYRMVPEHDGSTTFAVSNAGTSSSVLSWTALVDPSDTWLTITNGSSGTNSGTIAVNYDANQGDTRVGSITVTADDQYNSPQTVHVLQAANRSVKMIPSDGAAGDYFGYSVSISGDYAIIGAYGDDDNGNDSGSAYIFEREGNDWIQRAKLKPDDGTTGDYFGHSVSISGDYAIIGAYGDDDNGYNSGSAYIFEKPLAGWADMTETAKLTASDGYGKYDTYVPVYDAFGYSVSISGTYAIVGAVGVRRAGSAYIFKQPVNGWVDMTETAKLTPSDRGTAEAVGNFGSSVNISGNYAIVGADSFPYGNTHGGAAYLFEKPSVEWEDMTETAKVMASDQGYFENDFGISVGISGDDVVVGARFNDDKGTKSGSAYIFRKPLGSWTDMTETKKFNARDGASEDNFGNSVGLSGDYAIAGAPKDDDNGENSGSAYIYFAGNFPPTISNINDQVIDENTQTNPIKFTLSDSETIPEDLTLTGESSNNILVPNVNIVFGGSGVDRWVTITPNSNSTGITTIMVTSSDGVDTAVKSFILTVTAPDADRDGLPDTLESTMCSDPYDADTDDDGIPDGVEDANQNGILDPGETNPCNHDTDEDGIQDGTELGYSLADAGPDTDLVIFRPDLDPEGKTDPLKTDSDGDGIPDGGEDPNYNGRIDRGETDPLTDSIVYVDPAGICNDKVPCYTTLGGALTGSPTRKIIRVIQGALQESISFSTPKEFAVQGGFNNSYSANGGVTTVGNLLIADGLLALDKIIINPADAKVESSSLDESGLKRQHSQEKDPNP